jgi:hypothetical protein
VLKVLRTPVQQASPPQHPAYSHLSSYHDPRRGASAKKGNGLPLWAWVVGGLVLLLLIARIAAQSGGSHVATTAPVTVPTRPGESRAQANSAATPVPGAPEMSADAPSPPATEASVPSAAPTSGATSAPSAAPDAATAISGAAVEPTGNDTALREAEIAGIKVCVDQWVHTVWMDPQQLRLKLVTRSQFIASMVEYCGDPYGGGASGLSKEEARKLAEDQATHETSGIQTFMRRLDPSG